MITFEIDYVNGESYTNYEKRRKEERDYDSDLLKLMFSCGYLGFNGKVSMDFNNEFRKTKRTKEEKVEFLRDEIKKSAFCLMTDYDVEGMKEKWNKQEIQRFTPKKELEKKDRRQEIDNTIYSILEEREMQNFFNNLNKKGATNGK